MKRCYAIATNCSTLECEYLSISRFGMLHNATHWLSTEISGLVDLGSWGLSHPNAMERLANKMRVPLTTQKFKKKEGRPETWQTLGRRGLQHNALFLGSLVPWVMDVWD